LILNSPSVIWKGGAFDFPLPLVSPNQNPVPSNPAKERAPADSYLAAFAIAAQLTLVTFDQALSSKARQLVLLKP
jgi:hypothetical protein